MSKTVKLDFEPILIYFKNLTLDLMIAWGVLFVGIVLVIIALML